MGGGVALVCREGCECPYPRRNGATSSYEFSLLYRGRTAIADYLSALVDASDFDGFLGQSLSQSKCRNKSQDFEYGVPKDSRDLHERFVNEGFVG